MKPEAVNTQEVRYAMDSGGWIYRKDCPANCKLTYLNYIQYLGYIPDLEERKKKFDEILKQCRLAVYVNTNDDKLANFLEDKYELYSNSKIPIGYGGRYQYHIIIRNPHQTTNLNSRPSEYIRGEETAKEPQVTIGVKEKLLEILKHRPMKRKQVEALVQAL